MRERGEKKENKRNMFLFSTWLLNCIYKPKSAQAMCSFANTHVENKIKKKKIKKNHILEPGLKHKGKSHQPTMPSFTEQSIEMSMAVSELFLSILYLCHLPAKPMPHQHLTDYFASSRRNKELFLLSLSQIPFSSNLKAQTFHSKQPFTTDTT